MTVGISKEVRSGETRVACTPETVKKLIKKGHAVCVARDAGLAAGYSDASYVASGAEVVDADRALQAEVVLKIHKPSSEEILKMKKGSTLISMLEPYQADGTIERLAEMQVNAVAMELIPRTSRAQSMDVLSSQAGIAGYRAVIEAAANYPRFFPMMMTSAGSAKACRLAVLGVGVAGLQAIATARRLGAKVEAYDVRKEAREQVLSLGAKNIDLDLPEDGAGEGGYARELSEDTKRKQQALLAERLTAFDIIITTANIPGKKSPVLVLEETLKGMRPGSVIIDMAAANGGNCLLTEPDQICVKHGVTLVGITNYPARVPADASHFFGQNIYNLMEILWTSAAESAAESAGQSRLNLADDIVAAALIVNEGKTCLQK